MVLCRNRWSVSFRGLWTFPFEMLVKLSRALGQSSALRVDEKLQVRAQTLGASKLNEMTAQ